MLAEKIMGDNEEDVAHIWLGDVKNADFKNVGIESADIKNLMSWGDFFSVMRRLAFGHSRMNLPHMDFQIKYCLKVE